jgi:proline iminopeptidase
MIERRSFLALGGAAIAGAVCHRSDAASSASEKGLILPESTEVCTGGSRMIDIGGGHQVWTKKVGDGATKVLLLHGGPGGDHTFFECFEDFLPKNGIEFYYYDQLDSTNSDQPNDPKLWTIERFRDEVEAVRKGLGLEQFYLFGHSWGGMLGIEYGLAYQQSLKGLIISNMTAGIQAYEKHVAELRAALPDDVKTILDKYEKVGDYQAPEYQKVMFDEVYTRHLCRLNPWPEPVTRGFRHLNDKIYNYMQGPNEFMVTGTFKGWERWDDLPRIHTKTLILGAEYDEMSTQDLRKMAESMPNGEAWISENGSHLAMYDDQIPYFRRLLTFLKAAA